MSEINNSFTFRGSKDNLKKFYDDIQKSYITDADIDNYDENWDSETELSIWFDGFNSFKEFVTKFKKKAKKHKVNFNCNVISGWSLNGDLIVYTYRHKEDELKEYPLLPSHIQQVVEIDDGACVFNGITYQDWDVPGVIGKVMIHHFYGQENFNLAFDE